MLYNCTEKWSEDVLYLHLIGRVRAPSNPSCSGMIWPAETSFFINGVLSPQLSVDIYIYSFSRRFNPKWLTLEEYSKWCIIKSQTDTGSACNTTLHRRGSEQIIARHGEVKERAQVVFFRWSQVMMEEVSFQVWQGSSVPDGGGDHSTSRERWMKTFWKVILSLSVMSPRGVAHSQISVVESLNLIDGYESGVQLDRTNHFINVPFIFFSKHFRCEPIFILEPLKNMLLFFFKQVLTSYSFRSWVGWFRQVVLMV